MATVGRPEVDVLDGLTTAIIVDQERMGANSRSTVGTATDANAMLRVLFSRLGKPHVGSSNAFSFNVPSVRGAGAITVEKGGVSKTEKRTYVVTGGMCPRCEGMGSVSDIDLTQLYDDSKSINDGALRVPGYTTDGWMVRIFAAAGISFNTAFGATDTSLYGAIISLQRQLIVLLPVAALLAWITKDIDGIWWAFPIAEFVTLIVATLLFRRLYRRKIAPLDEPEPIKQ
jgi:excinuclease UvrABC ATPase subunit